MINDVLLYVLITPILINAVITISMALFGIAAIVYAVSTGKYTLIGKIDSWFASDSVPYTASMITIGILIFTFALHCIGFINTSIFSVFIGLALYPSLWYLIYVIDVWYNNYKQYKVKKSILSKGNKS